MIPRELKKELEHQHYKVVGGHSAVKLCHWTKQSTKGKGICYKQKFYPEFVKSHRCLQMTPWLPCTNQCAYCWRIIEKTPFTIEKVDGPARIIEGCLEGQRRLLSGLKGFEGTSLKLWKEAQNPGNVAISLAGEPTLYPKLSELIQEFHQRNIVTFLVTNGQLPERLETLEEPKQLYISLDAPDKETYKKLDRPNLKDFWPRLLKSLGLMNSFSCRKVLRLTLVKGWNMKHVRKYAKLIERANPDLLECKAYIHIGESQKRLERSCMPLHPEVKAFAEKLSKECGYAYKDEHKASRVVLLRG